jgi:hypothetical protein
VAIKRPRVFTVVVGIAVGYVWTAAEAIEDKLKAGSRPSLKHTDKRR